MESKSLSLLNLLHPGIRQSAIDAYSKAVNDTPTDVRPLITSTLRTFDEQAAIYAQGRTSPGAIVTNSKPGQSYHNFGLALDFVLVIHGKLIWEVDNNWMIVVNSFKEYGFDWGGGWKGFKDYPHLENRLGMNWKQMLALHDSKQFILGTDYILA